MQKQENLITVQLTEKECSQIRACIKLALMDEEQRYHTQLAEGDPSYDLKAELDYYSALADKFDR